MLSSSDASGENDVYAAHMDVRSALSQEYSTPMNTIPASRLTAAQRQRGIWALMTSTFFSWGGFFLVVPLVAVHYVDHLGWTAGAVGIVLALRQLAQQGGSVFFGILADRTGPKPLMATGMLVRAVGFGAMGFAESFWPVLGALLLAGLGGALFEAPNAAALASLSTPETRRRIFSIFGVIAGVGTAIGTQLGALLIAADFRLVCLVGGAAFVIIFVVLTIALPNIAVSATPSGTTDGGTRLVFRDRTFLLFLVFLAGYWFISAQFGLAIVLYATDLTGSDRAVSWLYLVNTLFTVVLGYILPRYLERWLSALGLLIAGVTIMAVVIFMVGFTTGITTLLIAAAFFSIGSVLASPGQETVLANLAAPSARGAYFGVAGLSLAVGGGLGNYLGGTLYDIGTHPGRGMLPWTIFCLVGLAAVGGMIARRRDFGVVRDQHDVPTASAPGPKSSPEMAMPD